jgi:hypothetical protein
LRAVFINHCHPDTPHVCATRMREFANAMAARGHRIVLLTETLNPGDAGPDPAALPGLLEAHDWSSPFNLACPPRATVVTARLQAGRLPPALSKPAALWCYLAKGGVFWTWAEGSRPYWRALADAFRPDVAWATFGNVDALNIARGIAGMSGCRWVMDVKDYWSVFLPAPLRNVIARRYADAAALTALSETNLNEVRPWFGQSGRVVYSGYPDSHLHPPAADDDGVFRLMLTGSVYDDALLAQAIDAFATWATGPDGPGGDHARFVYAGGDHARVARAAERLNGICEVEIERYLPLADLFARQCKAGANLYLRSTTFHHKLIELLAARRPVVSFPGEGAEAEKLTRVIRVPFHACTDAAGLAAAFTAARSLPAGPLPVAEEALARLTWAGQAAALETALQRVADGAAQGSGQSAARGL